MKVGEHVAALDAQVSGLRDQIHEVKNDVKALREQSTAEHTRLRDELHGLMIKTAILITVVVIVLDFITSSGTLSLESMLGK